MTQTTEDQTMYNYLKDEYRLEGNIQYSEDEPDHFSDFKYNSYYGRVLEDIDKIKKEDINKCWYFPKYLSFGHYDHSCHIERSNVEVFLKGFGHIDGIRHIYGAYGSEAIVIRLDTPISEFIETLEVLQSYPVINEEHASQLEQDMIQEAWEDYGREDLQDALNKEYTLHYNADQVREAVRWLGYEMIEAGGTVYFDVDGMIEEYHKQAIKKQGECFE